MKAAFTTRPMELKDIGSAFKLSAEEGWNQTESDWKLFVQNSENICIVAEIGNKVIGTTAAINYANQVAWIGMVLVDRDFRRQGISKALFNEILKRLGHCKSVKLDATPEGQLVYRKFDFKDEYQIVRMTNTSLTNFEYCVEDDKIPLPISQHDLAETVAFDSINFGAKRTGLIETLVKEHPEKAWLLKRDHSVTGYTAGRDGNRYHHIGPVTAATTAEAKILISKALQKLTGQPVIADILCDKEDLLSWFASAGFLKQRYFTRMYKKENPFPGLIDKQYLICGPEFG